MIDPINEFLRLLSLGYAPTVARERALARMDSRDGLRWPANVRIQVDLERSRRVTYAVGVTTTKLLTESEETTSG